VSPSVIEIYDIMIYYAVAKRFSTKRNTH